MWFITKHLFFFFLVLKLELGFNVFLHACYPLVETVLKLSKDQQGNLKTKGPGFQASRVPDREQVFHLGFLSVCGRAPCAWHCPKHLTKSTHWTCITILWGGLLLFRWGARGSYIPNTRSYCWFSVKLGFDAVNLVPDSVFLTTRLWRSENPKKR